MRLVARPLVDRARGGDLRRRVRPDPAAGAAARRPRPAARRRRRRARRAGRRPHGLRARRGRRPARAVDERRRRRAARLGDLFARARAHARGGPRRRRSPSGSGRGRRSCTRCCGARSAGRWSSTCTARRPATRAPTRASRCCCGTWPSAGASCVADGILVPLPLTHRLIGQLVGAERPSVSHALAPPVERRARHARARTAWSCTGRPPTTSRASSTATTARRGYERRRSSPRARPRPSSSPST